MRLRKISLVFLLVLLLTVNCFALGWDLIVKDTDPRKNGNTQWRQIVSTALHTILALYALLVVFLMFAKPNVDDSDFVESVLHRHGSARVSSKHALRGRSAGPSSTTITSVQSDTEGEGIDSTSAEAIFVLSDPKHRTRTHRHALVHLASLATIVFSGLVVIGVLPSSAARIIGGGTEDSDADSDVVADLAFIVQLVVWGMVWYFVTNTRMKPNLVFPMEQMYSEKVLALAAAGGEEVKEVKKEGDVCGAVG